MKRFCLVKEIIFYLFHYAIHKDSVPYDISRADKELIQKLEKQEGSLKSESDRLKEVAEIAQYQTESITLRQRSQEKELTSLRKQLYELQMETDEKTIIGKAVRFCFNRKDTN